MWLTKRIRLNFIPQFFVNPDAAVELLLLSSSGMKELSPPALNLKRLVKETVPGEPILIVISPGADPSQVSVLTRLFFSLKT